VEAGLTDKITAEEVSERCESLGFTITKTGFAQYIADICNQPIRIGPVPIYFATEPFPLIINNGWLYR